MIEYVILAIVALNFIGLGIDLWIDLRSLPLRRRDIKEHAADMGIALAERMAKLHVKAIGEKTMTSLDKVKMAVDWAVEHCREVGVTVTPAEMRMLIEIRLERQTKTPQ